MLKKYQRFYAFYTVKWYKMISIESNPPSGLPFFSYNNGNIRRSPFTSKLSSYLVSIKIYVVSLLNYQRKNTTLLFFKILLSSHFDIFPCPTCVLTVVSLKTKPTIRVCFTSRLGLLYEYALRYFFIYFSLYGFIHVILKQPLSFKINSVCEKNISSDQLFSTSTAAFRLK